MPVRAQESAQASTDLDAFMARVLERRSENWKALKDYVLNEKEHFELLGPGRARIFGINREYTWYLRDGLLVRSPVRFDGVAINADERKKYEDNWTREERHRDERRARRNAHADAAADDDDAPKDVKGESDVAALAREASEPRIISQAYFMDFRFEPGNYYLAGRETLEGRQVLRIEYYPEHLFDSDESHRSRRGDKRAYREKDNGNKDKSGADGGGQEKKSKDKRDRDEQFEQDFERKFNKVALVTLWVDPQEHQIVKFTFNNLDFGFLPGRWLVRADDMTASMVMSQPIQGIWLPREISGSGRITLANGSYEIRYGREFYDYQQGEVKTRIRGYTPKEQ